MRNTRFFTRALLAAVALVAAMSTFLIGNDGASAATQTMTHPFTGSTAPVNVFTITGLCDVCIPDALHSGAESALGATVSGDVSLAWAADTSTELSYTPGLLRQGSTLDASDKLTTNAGTVTVNYTLSGTAGIFVDEAGHAGFDPNDFLPVPSETIGLSVGFAQAIPCIMPLPGESPRDCTRTDTVTLFSGNFFIVDVSLRLRLETTVAVDGSGVAFLRKVAVTGGQPIADAPLTFGGTSPSTLADPIAISCLQPAGQELSYALTNAAYSADQSLGHKVFVNVLVELVIVGTDIVDGDIFSLTAPTVAFPTLALSAPDQIVTLGTVQADLTPPTISSVGGPYTGTEGSPIQFTATATDNCGPPTLRWDFSDGGVAFGANPQHTFADNGVYSGLITATDVTGLTTTATFSVTVTNVAPAVSAGPDKQSDWGVAVAFHANGSDQGPADNGSLLYTWDFNDSFDPIGAAGQDAGHVFSQPGTYNVVVTVKDKDGGSSTDTVQVTITPRDTPISYTGDVSANITDTAHFRATLTDEYGQPVVGRLITFRFDGVGVVNALTDGFGVAQANWAIPLGTSVGNHTIDAQFAGDSMYKLDGTATVTFVVSKESAVLTYTGVLSSKPSRPVVLTAKLTDDDGNPIAGKLITFTLGSQGCSATTNASGIATCTIAKLTQKSGPYQLGTSFGGNGDFNAATDLDTFKIG